MAGGAIKENGAEFRKLVVLGQECIHTRECGALCPPTWRSRGYGAARGCY